MYDCASVLIELVCVFVDGGVLCVMLSDVVMML